MKHFQVYYLDTFSSTLMLRFTFQISIGEVYQIYRNRLETVAFLCFKGWARSPRLVWSPGLHSGLVILEVEPDRPRLAERYHLQKELCHRAELYHPTGVVFLDLNRQGFQDRDPHPNFLHPEGSYPAYFRHVEKPALSDHENLQQERKFAMIEHMACWGICVEDLVLDQYKIHIIQKISGIQVDTIVELWYLVKT